MSRSKSHFEDLTSIEHVFLSVATHLDGLTVSHLLLVCAKEKTGNDDNNNDDDGKEIKRAIVRRKEVTHVTILDISFLFLFLPPDLHIIKN